MMFFYRDDACCALEASLSKNVDRGWVQVSGNERNERLDEGWEGAKMVR